LAAVTVGAVMVPPDRFDEIRRKRIARYQYSFAFQKRRAELLARQIRDRDTDRASARVDPADDDVMHPWWLRPVNTSYAALDWAIFMTVGVLAPIGWLVGKVIYKVIIQLIPDELCGYPIAACCWSAVATGMPFPVVCAIWTPGDLTSALVLPWLFAQLPATLLVAGVYGILDGWLAIDASRGIWPMRPPPERDDVYVGIEPDDLTRPGVFPVHREGTPGDPVPRRNLTYYRHRSGRMLRSLLGM
jgi:hypothetical protein